MTAQIYDIGYAVGLQRKADRMIDNLIWTQTHVQLTPAESRSIAQIITELRHASAEITRVIVTKVGVVKSGDLAKFISQLLMWMGRGGAKIDQIFQPNNQPQTTPSANNNEGNTPAGDPYDGGDDQDLNQVAKNEPTHTSDDDGTKNWTTEGDPGRGPGTGTTTTTHDNDDQSSSENDTQPDDDQDLASSEGQTDPGGDDDTGMGDPDSGDDEGPHLHFGGYHPSNSGGGPLDDEPVIFQYGSLGLGPNAQAGGLGWYQSGGAGGSDWGGSNPRFFGDMPDPETTGGGNPRSRNANNPDYFPDPEGDGGGVGPRSVIF